MKKMIAITSKYRATIMDVAAVAKENVGIILGKDVCVRIKRSRNIVEEAVNSGKAVYGVTTGFGKLKNQFISKDKVEELQENLIRSHAVGIGEPYSQDETRAILFVRLLSLAQGYSGVRLDVLEKIIELLNKNIVPRVPSQGSVGCSGDLAPLSHISLVLLGRGEVFYKGKIVPTDRIFKKLKIEPIVLREKEGLALNNGTSVMTAIAALNLSRALNLAKTADIVGAITLETAMGTLTAFSDDIQKVRSHDGQKKVARNFQKLCEKSEIMESHKKCARIQDSYTLRCIPQVHGAARDAIEYCKEKIEIELNSATDNPLIFPESGEIKSGGNFHGEPIALAMDFLAIALSELGNISERRTFKLLTPELNEGLPPFLIGSKEIGLNSGLMITQYVSASLVAENKVYAHPVSVDSIPTSANQEDHVSFGTIAANKCRKIIDNLENILAIELLCATQAAEFRKPLRLGRGSQIVFKEIRKNVKKLKEDRALYMDIEKIRNVIREKMLITKLINRGIKVN